jgi:phospholipase A1
MLKTTTMLTSFATAIGFLTVLPASAADVSHCRGISDNHARLVCYDQAVDVIGGAGPNVADSTNGTPTAAVATVEQSTNRLSKRIARERAMANDPFVITLHQRNYLLPVTYNSKSNEDVWNSIFPDAVMDDVEAKFQISLKALVWKNLIGSGDLWGAYTQQSWWQVYNSDESAPFRETNYEPEVTMVWPNDWKIAGLTNTSFTLGLNHQSNGRSEFLSRSWNRIIAGATFEKSNFVTRLRLWHRFEESEGDDDNPNMGKFYGHGDLLLAYHRGHHEFAALVRNNLHFNGGNKGALQLDWTYPLSERFSWYIQYFYGYGESLIDYDVKTSRIGVGFAMNNLF